MKMNHIDTQKNFIDTSQGCKAPKKEEFREDTNKLDER